MYKEALELHGTHAKAASALGIAKSTFTDRLAKEVKKNSAQDKKLTLKNITEKIAPASGAFTKIVYFTDAHNQPGLPKDRFFWLARLINEHKPDVVVDGGDGDDFNSLCTHERDETYRGRLKPLLAADLECAAEMRSVLKNNITHQCRKVITLGNHEARIWLYEDKNPAMHGIVSSMYEDILKATGWEIYQYGAYVNIAGVDFTHAPFTGMGKPVGGDNACKQVAEKSLHDICWGHTHRLDVVNAAKFGNARSVISFNGGCFMPDGYVPSYAKDTRKEFWYGCHIVIVKDGRIKSIKSWHMSELEDLYGR